MSLKIIGFTLFEISQDFHIKGYFLENSYSNSVAFYLQI